MARFIFWHAGNGAFLDGLGVLAEDLLAVPARGALLRTDLVIQKSRILCALLNSVRVLTQNLLGEPTLALTAVDTVLVQNRGRKGLCRGRGESDSDQEKAHGDAEDGFAESDPDGDGEPGGSAEPCAESSGGGFRNLLGESGENGEARGDEPGGLYGNPVQTCCGRSGDLHLLLLRARNGIDPALKERLLQEIVAQLNGFSILEDKAAADVLHEIPDSGPRLFVYHGLLWEIALEIG